MISLEEFKHASFETKCDTIIAHAEYVAVRRSGNCKIFLYRLWAYYIEVYYSPAFKRVLLMNAFDDVSGLFPYADAISIDDIDR